MLYSILSEDDESVITVVVPGDPGSPYIASGDHPNFERIVAGVLADDESVVDLFDVTLTVAKKFERLSDRVTAAHGRIFFDGDEVNNALTKQILRVLEENQLGDNGWGALVNFFEKVQQNPQPHSRDQLYEWLDRHDFTITPDGDIVGYKGVAKDGAGNLVSVHSGRAVVDGEEVTGQIPNEFGSVIEMPRGSVNHDPSNGCSTGLHVGTYDYAKYYSSGAMLEVHVNPRDVVSVPTDSNWQKVRCCRYKVVDVIDQPYSTAVLDVDGSRDDDEHFTDIDLGFDWED